jgi:hypothetical protein
MKNVVIWDVRPYGSCKNQSFGGTYQVDKNRRARNNVSPQLAPVANCYNIPSSLFLLTMIIEAIHSSETSVRTRATRRNIPEDGILYSHHLEELKSYIALTGWTL